MMSVKCWLTVRWRTHEIVQTSNFNHKQPGRRAFIIMYGLDVPISLWDFNFVIKFKLKILKASRDQSCKTTDKTRNKWCMITKIAIATFDMAIESIEKPKKSAAKYCILEEFWSTAQLKESTWLVKEDKNKKCITMALTNALFDQYFSKLNTYFFEMYQCCCLKQTLCRLKSIMDTLVKAWKFLFSLPILRWVRSISVSLDSDLCQRFDVCNRKKPLLDVNISRIMLEESY